MTRTTRPPDPLLAELLRQHPRPAARRWEGIYLRTVQALALVVGLAVSLGLWWLGARYTVQALGRVGLPVGHWGLVSYAAPLAITLVEIGFWPRARQPWTLRLQWLTCLLVDSLTSALGLRRDLAWLLPSDAAAQWLVTVGLGIGLAVLPERMARSMSTLLVGEVLR